MPSKRTRSSGCTLYPISVTKLPFTSTLPCSIYVSASLREQTPELAMYLFRRIPVDSSDLGPSLILVNVFLGLFLLKGVLFLLDGALFLLRGVLFLPSCRPLDEFLSDFIIKIFAKVVIFLNSSSIY